MGIPDHLTCLLINLYAGQEQQLELDMEQQTGSKLEKEYIKAVYCHPAYLSHMQSTSYAFSKMLHLQEDSKKGIIQVLDNFHITPLNRRRNFKILMETLMVS